VRNAWKNTVLAGAVVLTALLAVAAVPACGPGAAAAVDGTWVVHEWGTYLSVQGSDGVTLGGMVDSEEALPLWVRERDLGGRSRASYYGKMETPVTYFYTDRPRQVRVRVEMPGGLLTHWFPDVHAVTPALPPAPKTEEATVDRPKTTPQPAGSSLDWGTFQVLPDDRFLPAGRQTSEKGAPRTCWVGPESTWRFARATDSALVRTNVPGKELVEKFLFYRGLGTFNLPLEVRSTGPDDRLQLLLHNPGAEPLQGLFAVWVMNGAVRLAVLDDLPGGSTRDVDAATAFTAWQPLEDGVGHLKHAVADSLIKAGLYPKEARAMVDTWEKSYFRNDGLRILSVLPRSAVDAAIPIDIKPAPQELVRILVGRVEVLTPEAEHRLEQVVAALGSEDAKEREAAEAELAKYGRLREPVLRRIMALTRQPEVRARAETLIARGAAKK
jgi:hypothetical protein